MNKPDDIDIIERFNDFIKSADFREINLSGKKWEYISAGNGKNNLLLLPGIDGKAVTLWQDILYYSRRFRVIAFSYPPIPDITTMTRQMLGILDKEFPGNISLIGKSYGGFVSQVLIRENPELFNKVVLSHTFLPLPPRGRKIALLFPFFKLLPEFMVKRLYRKNLSKIFRGQRVRKEMSEARAYFKEALMKLTSKEDILCSYSRIKEYDLNYNLSGHEKLPETGNILLVFGDNDPVCPPEMRKKMEVIYRGAQKYIFSGTGHSAPIVKREEYLKIIDDFLDIGNA